jgi:acyl homoserine lactone synthase
MKVSYGPAKSLDQIDIAHLYAYRYAVFVQRMGWELPDAKNGLEIDRFDRADTIHVMVRNDDGHICGCARLLPTIRPYLLSEMFPQLMRGCALPRSSDIWELSRFSSADLSRNMASPIWVCKEVMAATVACAIEVGAKQLIAVTSRGVERILGRLGVNWHAVGPAQQIDGNAVFAFRLEIDDKTLDALGLSNLLSVA